MYEVPVVDLSPFTVDGDITTRRKAARYLAEKCKVNGCVAISGHGISADRLKAAFAVSEKLFNLPYEEKMKAPHPDAVVPHRGYSGPGREQGAKKGALDEVDDAKRAELERTTDQKESYEIGSEHNTVNYNIWLPEESLPGFREFALKLFWELHQLASAVLEALIMSLNLKDEEARAVRAMHTGHENQLRLLHYPSVQRPEQKEDQVSRLGAHTDWSSFTLLFQDAHGGLEFEDRSSGSFVSAPPLDGVMYMNIGDMFQRLSNGFYPSAKHRVVVSRRDGSHSVAGPRYSIPYFVAPSGNALVKPQPSLVAMDGKALFDPVTPNEYSERMFAAINVYSE